MLHAIRLTQQQLIDQVFRLFAYHNSCIKYFNDIVYLGKKGYTLKTAPDGSTTEIVRSIEDIGKAKDNFVPFDMHGQTTPVIAEKPIITWKYNDNAATAHVETTELLHLYQQLTGNKVVLV